MFQRWFNVDVFAGLQAKVIDMLIKQIRFR